MPIDRLVGQGVFDPEQIATIKSAFEGALKALDLADRSDPLTEIVAKAIIELAMAGETDPDVLRDKALAALSR